MTRLSFPTLTSMHPATTALDRALHLALFVAGGIAFAVAALAVLERLGEREGRRVIRVPHVAMAIAAVAALAIAERLYHYLR